MITQKYLKEIVHYDPDTGIFTWTINRKKVSAGAVAGHNCNGYVSLSINNKNYRAHRLAFLYMTGEWPEFVVDHVNRIRSDNRWCNLRDVTQQVNSTNKINHNNGVASKSVSKTNAGRFKAYLYLGTFATHEEADDACDKNLNKLKDH
jgi:hypothetical protein